MIDHAAARSSLAGALDFPLDPEDADVLDHHLRDCSACRSFKSSLGQDAAALGRLSFGPVPVAVRVDIAIAAEHGRRAGAGRWLAILAVGALLVLAVGGGLLSGGSPPPPDEATGTQVHWSTRVVDLASADFWIEANGLRFDADDTQVSASSDLGDATYRTLEVAWLEHGTQMRVSLYFDGDATSWWVREIRIYDGTPQGEWLTATGRFAGGPIGRTWAGDLEVPFADGSRLHLGDATLRSIPFDSVNEPVGANGIVLRPDDRPFGPNGPLHCSGILQMTPVEAEATLLDLGYRLSWRLARTTGPKAEFAEILPRAPGGIITDEGVPGSTGELILTVMAPEDVNARPIPVPADCPVAGGSPPVPQGSPAAPKP